MSEAETAGHLLVRACRTESLPAFRQMSRSRDDEYLSRQTSSAVVEAGLLCIERDRFLDPKEQVDTVAVGTEDMKDPGDLWFSVATPRPRSLDQVLAVQVETQALTVACPQDEGSPLTVTLLGNQAMWGSDMLLPILSDVAFPPRQERVTFPRLQRGRHQVMVGGKDGFWQSEEVTLGRRPRTVTRGPVRSMEDELMEMALRSNP